jgi:hypothetical protein
MMEREVHGYLLQVYTLPFLGHKQLLNRKLLVSMCSSNWRVFTVNTSLTAFLKEVFVVLAAEVLEPEHVLFYIIYTTLQTTVGHFQL